MDTPEYAVSQISFYSTAVVDRVEIGTPDGEPQFMDGRTRSELTLQVTVMGAPASISKLNGDLSQLGGDAIIEKLASALGSSSSDRSESVAVSVTPMVDGKPGPSHRLVFESDQPALQFVQMDYPIAVDGVACWVRGAVAIHGARLT